MLNLHHPGQKWDKSHCCERFKPEGAARHQLQALPGSIDEVIALLTFPVSTPENGILGFFTSGCIGKGKKHIYIYSFALRGLVYCHSFNSAAAKSSPVNSVCVCVGT